MPDKKIEDYLHLYLGCEYVLKIDSGQRFTKPAILNATALGAAIHKHQKPIEPILLLRPLSDMSEEEKKHIDYPAYQIFRSDKQITSKVTPAISWAANQTFYLLSKHFDLFGLIEAGLAIDKTTLK